MPGNEMHFRLRTLGAAQIVAHDARVTPPRLSPRQLALLAYLVAAPTKEASRDIALALLWPESDERHARNCLKQVVFRIRAAIGHDVLRVDQYSMRVDERLLSHDRGEFEAALARRDLGVADRLYLGPFLAGFHLPGLHEFNRWAEDERERLAGRHRQAVESLARRAEDAHDVETALRWWQRLADLDPFRDTYVVGVGRALTTLGRTAEAMQQLKRFDSRVREELGTPSSAEVRALLERLARLSADESQRHASIPHPQPAPAIVTTAGEDGRLRQMPERGQAGGGVSGSIDPPPVTTMRRPARLARALRVGRGAPHRLRRGALLTLVAIDVALFMANRSALSAPTGAAESPLSMGVLVLSPTSGDRSAPEGICDALGELLESRLEGIAGLSLRRAPPAAAGHEPAVTLAAAVDARYFVRIDVAARDDSIRARAWMLDRLDESVPVLEVSLAVPANDLPTLADALALRLLESGIGGPGAARMRAAVRSTRSLTAALAYLEGERLSQEGEFAAARDAYARAMATDSGFALAGGRLALVAMLTGDRARAESEARRAASISASLRPDQRALLAARAVEFRGALASAELAYRDAVSRWPEENEGWLSYGLFLLRHGPRRGQALEDARGPLEAALRIDRGNPIALVALGRLEAWAGHGDSATRLIARAARSTSASAVGRHAFHLLSMSGPDRVDAVAPRESAAGTGIGEATVELLTLADDRALERVARELLVHAASPELVTRGRWLLALSALASGSSAAAFAQLDSMDVDPDRRSEIRAYLALAADSGVTRDTLRRIGRELQRWRPAQGGSAGHESHATLHAALRLHHHGLIALRLGDLAASQADADALHAVARTEDSGDALALFTSLDAHLAAARGDSGRALRLLEREPWTPSPPALALDVLDRLLRARLLEWAGRESEALSWYHSIGAFTVHEHPFVHRASASASRLLERLGRPHEAAVVRGRSPVDDLAARR